LRVPTVVDPVLNVCHKFIEERDKGMRTRGGLSIICRDGGGKRKRSVIYLAKTAIEL